MANDADVCGKRFACAALFVRDPVDCFLVYSGW